MSCPQLNAAVGDIIHWLYELWQLSGGRTAGITLVIC